MSGSENVYMQIISGCCKKKYIKNHNLCKTISIILILSFILGILVSYLQRRTLKELMCIKKIVDSLMHAMVSRGGGRGGNQSCLTADMWFHLVCGNTIPVRSKRSLREGQRSHPEEPPSGATLRSHPQDPPTLRSHPRVAPEGVKVTALY